MSDEDTFATRWARRKRAVAEEEAAAAAPSPPSAPEPREEESEEEALQRLGLPDPDTLGEGDDFSGFMKAGVPEVLRRRALRRLWASNPVLANVDGLVEYGENYASPDLIPDVVATAYKVGQGFVKKVVELAEAEELPETEPPTAQDARTAAEGPLPAGDGADDMPERGALSHQPEDSETPVQSDASSLERQIALQPKRMRFRSKT